MNNQKHALFTHILICRPRNAFAVCALLAASLVGVFNVRLATLQAQPQDTWTEPVNLSRSGSASNPTLVSGKGEAVQAFWLDRFDGMMTSVYRGGEWSAPVSKPIFARVGQDIKPVSMTNMPRLLADGRGWAHAWWQGSPDPQTGARPIFHSSLWVGQTGWTVAQTVVESAVAFDVVSDIWGGLHLAYIRQLHRDVQPAGLYYIFSGDGGASWSDPVALYRSIYFRLLGPDEASISLGVSPEGHVYVVWSDPRLEKSFFSTSADGRWWAAPRELTEIRGPKPLMHLLALPTGRLLLLWKDSQTAACAFYQQLSSDGGETWSAPQRVLERLRDCEAKLAFHRLADGNPLLVGGSGGPTLTLAAWDGKRWSELKMLSWRFLHPELNRHVSLADLQLALAADGSLFAVGTSPDGDIWATRSQVQALEWVFAPPSPWTEAALLSQVPGITGLPAIAGDSEGRVHVVWGQRVGVEENKWALYYTRWDEARAASAGRPGQLRAIEILSFEDMVTEPSLAAARSLLHMVWVGGKEGRVLYSQANAREAYAAGAWSEPRSLPAPMLGSSPVIVADAYGILHVLYAVPFNENRGIYYMRSEDEGRTWSEAQRVFDVVAAGWISVGQPALAVDEQGGVHAAWVRVPRPDAQLLPEGVYYSSSFDGGETWSNPTKVAEGAYRWPRLACSALGQLHVLWNEATGTQGWWQRWSTDGGRSWTRPERIQGWGDVAGPVGLVADGTGALHLTGLGRDTYGVTALAYATWDGTRWSRRENHRLEPVPELSRGLAVLAQLGLGRLHVVFLGIGGETGGSALALHAVSRNIPAVSVTPAPTLTPLPTDTPKPVPTPTPTWRADVAVAAPLPAGRPTDLPLPVVIATLLAASLAVGVLLTRPLWARRR